MNPVLGDAELRAAGTSPAAIARHYDLSDDFFEQWLGSDLVYSCALWDFDDPDDTLARAQARKLDWFARQLDVTERRVLDIGCGWGALLDRFTRRHGAASGVGLTLSRNQVDRGRRRGTPGVDFRLESWVDHAPAAPYDVITCIEATEHLASDALDDAQKVEVYQSFFARCASWLTEGGRLGLQLICLDNVGHEGSRPERGPLSELIRLHIFPESMPSCLSEMALGWEEHFRLDAFLDHPDHYVRTFRAWGQAARADRARAAELVGPEVARRFERYFAVGEAVFRLREDSLYRVVLTRRPAPKRFAAAPRPVPLRAGASEPTGTSPAAVRAHYDVSNEFYELVLGPTLVYTSGLWASGSDDTQEHAAARKVDFFARHLGVGASTRVLDVGCGWLGPLRLLAAGAGYSSAVGLTLSDEQAQYSDAHPLAATEVRVESWADHEPAHPYDAVIAFGAFEHFAREGTASDERVHGYRAFFARCFEWLSDGGRVGIETIGLDDAPDTLVAPSRGPLAASVTELYPEALAPHLHELVLAFEPWFEVEVLRSDAADFARTARAWLLNLRRNEATATELVGAEVVRRYARYLASTEVQFRLRAITNYRVVLHRRPAPRR